jgi:hypothetical protein
MAVFDDARDRLPESDRALIDACLTTWSADPEWRYVADNLRSECALALDDFEQLLRDLAAELRSIDPQGRLDADAWRTLWQRACKPYEFRGRPVANERRPATLGRAWSVGSLARSVTRATRLPERAARRLLDKHLATIPPPPQLRANLEVTPLGGALIWATLDPDDAARDPFDRLPATAAAVQCALGLGCHPAGEAIVALTYSTAPPAHGLPLHRPTVADANSYFYYRPYDDPTLPWGFTAPLDPNPHGLHGMPEIVHGQIKGDALLRHRLLR